MDCNPILFYTSKKNLGLCVFWTDRSTKALTKEISMIFPNWKIWLNIVLTSLSQMKTKSHVKLTIIKPELCWSGLLVICLGDLFFWQISFSYWVILNHGLKLLGVCEFEIETVFFTLSQGWSAFQVRENWFHDLFFDMLCFCSSFFWLKYRSVESIFVYKMKMRCNDNFLSWSF